VVRSLADSAESAGMAVDFARQVVCGYCFYNKTGERQMGRVVFLGVEGAGKSVLTVALARYFEQHQEHGWSLMPENKEAFAFQERMPKRFSTGELPAQTAKFRHLRWSICYDDEPQRTLDVLDYPGEIYRLAFLDPNDDPNPEALRARQQACANEIRELMGFLKGAEQVFILFNINDAKNLDTDNANIDAVWITMSAIKILSSLENSPELTLLITQADRLEKDGEPVDDAEAIMEKHLPLVRRRFKRLSKMVISGIDYDNPRYGMLQLACSLLKDTVVLRSFLSEEDKFTADLQNGTAKESEYERLSKIASRHSWILQNAVDFIGKEKEFKECFAVTKKCNEIMRGSESNNRKKVLLEGVLSKARFDSSKAVVRTRLRSLDELISNNHTDIAFAVMLGVCGFIAFLLIIIVVVAGK
jgi:hypothetical protein